MNNHSRWSKSSHDVHYTPRTVAKEIIDAFEGYMKKGDVVLEPAAGDGAFLSQFPQFVKTDWCEISQGKDFFDYTSSVDWIITNPPYSLLTRWMNHCWSLSGHVVLLLPLEKVFASGARVRGWVNAGFGIHTIYCLPSNRMKEAERHNHVGAGGKPWCAVYFQKAYHGYTHWLNIQAWNAAGKGT